MNPIATILTRIQISENFILCSILQGFSIVSHICVAENKKKLESIDYMMKVSWTLLGKNVSRIVA